MNLYPLAFTDLRLVLLGREGLCLIHKVFFYNVDPPKENIFLTTIYSLYFSHQHAYVLQITIFHMLDLFRQLSCTASTHSWLCFKRIVTRLAEPSHHGWIISFIISQVLQIKIFENCFLNWGLTNFSFNFRYVNSAMLSKH